MSGRGGLLGDCDIGAGLRGGLIDVVPGAEDDDGRLWVTLPDLGYKFRPFAVGERQVEQHQVKRLAASDQGPAFL